MPTVLSGGSHVDGSTVAAIFWRMGASCVGSKMDIEQQRSVKARGSAILRSSRTERLDPALNILATAIPDFIGTARPTTAKTTQRSGGAEGHGEPVPGTPAVYLLGWDRRSPGRHIGLRAGP